MTTAAEGAGVDTAAAVAALMAKLPKVELHVHLEGTLSAERLRAIAARDGLDVDPRAYHPALAEPGFGAFLTAFMARLRALRTPDDWATALDDLLRCQSEQGVAYTEAFVTLTGALRGDYVLADVLRAMAEVEADWRRRRCGLRLVLDAPRELGADVCAQLARLAAADPTGLLVGIGIGGDETVAPAQAFVEPFALAARLGLHRTAHAGEHAGPESVAAAVRLLGVERVGHAVSAVEDGAVVALLRDRGVTVDVCPGSNRATGAWDPARGPHPVGRLVAAGVRIDVGTDDPAIFGTNLCAEWSALVLEHGLSPHRCLELCLAAVDACFLPDPERSRLRWQLEADLVDLRDQAAALEEAMAV